MNLRQAAEALRLAHRGMGRTHLDALAVSRNDCGYQALRFYAGWPYLASYHYQTRRQHPAVIVSRATNVRAQQDCALSCLVYMENALWLQRITC